MDGQLLEAGANAAVLFQPADALFDHSPAAVRLAVKANSGIMPRLLVLLVRNDRLDALLGQPVPHSLHAIPFVGGESAGPVSSFASLPSASEATRQRLADIAEWGLARGCIVRFLEVMPIGPMAHVAEHHLVPAAEILERLGERFELRPIPQAKGQPAEDFAASGRGLRGVIGIIADVTRPFCSRCRRLRLTARGRSHCLRYRVV